MRLLGDFRPDIVFHAAALKHVPLLERDWGEGVKTNVFGPVNGGGAAAPPRVRSRAVVPLGAYGAFYVLKWAQPVRIVDLAERMIRLSGLEPGRDIDIEFTGIRPGARLHQIIFARNEPTGRIG